jgi:hypothetical protein
MPKDFFDLRSCPQIRNVETIENASNDNNFRLEVINVLNRAGTDSPSVPLG